MLPFAFALRASLPSSLHQRPQKGKEREREAGDLWSGIGDEEGEADGMEVDAEEDLTEDEAARRQIMEGAIVKSVISNAVKGAFTLP